MLINSEIENFLKAKSSVYKETSGGKEIQIFCPYCGDAFRKYNPKWGHLYIHKETGLFYCHRCNEKGTLLKLLLDLDFDNKSIINELAKYYKLNEIYTDKPRQLVIDKTTTKINTTKYHSYWIRNKNAYIYFVFRTGIDDINQMVERYRCYPISDDSILFCNINYEPILERRLFDKMFRYKKIKPDEYYVLPGSADTFLIAEGVFDIINLDQYVEYQTSTKVAIGGKNYIKLVDLICRLYAPNNLILFVDNDIDVDKLKKFLMNYVAKKKLEVGEIHVKQNRLDKDVGSLAIDIG